MEILKKIKSKFSEHLIELSEPFGDITLVVNKEGIVGLVKYLKENNFELLLDITSVDYLNYNKSPRFEVVYHLYSIKKNIRLRVKVPLEENDLTIESISPYYKNANWLERETYDMYGIKFLNHPDLKRILMYEEFEGHPLRKDYPFRKRQPRIELLYPED